MTLFQSCTVRECINYIADRLDWEYVAHRQNDPDGTVVPVKSITIKENPLLADCYISSILQKEGGLVVQAKEYDMLHTLPFFDVAISSEEIQIIITEDPNDSSNISIILGRRNNDHNQETRYGITVS